MYKNLYGLVRPFLFRMDAEKAHELMLSLLHWTPSICFQKPPSGNRISAMGLTFPHATGLAAGLDKNGEHLAALSKIPFAFIEVGTVTPRPQEGNPLPRLFRLPEREAIINRMGFNNKGVDVLVSNVKKSGYQGILGINIGKNRDTPLSEAVEDYLVCLKKVYAHASYVTVNISSPNTPGLRQLQEAAYFSGLLKTLSEEKIKLADCHQKDMPVVIKISPDEEEETVKRMAEAVLEYNMAGIIATNTTSSRDGVLDLPLAKEAGGLSGAPLRERSLRCLRILKSVVGDEITLIGAGGIGDVPAAKEKLEAGARLLQVYTGLVYKGPALISEIVSGLQNIVI